MIHLKREWYEDNTPASLFHFLLKVNSMLGKTQLRHFSALYREGDPSEWTFSIFSTLHWNVMTREMISFFIRMIKHESVYLQAPQPKIFIYELIFYSQPGVQKNDHNCFSWLFNCFRARSFSEHEKWFGAAIAPCFSFLSGGLSAFHVHSSLMKWKSFGNRKQIGIVHAAKPRRQLLWKTFFSCLSASTRGREAFKNDSRINWKALALKASFWTIFLCINREPFAVPQRRGKGKRFRFPVHIVVVFEWLNRGFRLCLH